MKATLTAHLDKIETADGSTIVTFKTSEGNVETKNISAKPTTLEGTLTLKKLAAQHVKLGSKVLITIEITDDVEEL